MGQKAGKQRKSADPPPEPLGEKTSPSNHDSPSPPYSSPNAEIITTQNVHDLAEPPPCKPLAKRMSSSNCGPPPPYTSANDEIITIQEIQTGTKTLTWNTASFTKLRQLTSKGQEWTRSLPFKAGEGTPTPTSWSLDIRVNKEEELQFCLNLEHAEPDEDTITPIRYGYAKRNALANLFPSVKDPKDPTKILFYRNVGLREYIVDERRHIWMTLATMEELESIGALTEDILSIGIHLQIYRQKKSKKSRTVTTATNKMGETSTKKRPPTNQSISISTQIWANTCVKKCSSVPHLLFNHLQSTSNKMGGETSGSPPVTSTDPKDSFAVTSNAIDDMIIKEKKYFQELLKTGEGADFILRVKENQFSSKSKLVERKVHKAILSLIPIFAKMMASEMMKKKYGEIDSLTLDDISPLCLNVLIHFIYTGDVHEDWKLIPGEVERAADKYGLPLLKKELL